MQSTILAAICCGEASETSTCVLSKKYIGGTGSTFLILQSGLLVAFTGAVTCEREGATVENAFGAGKDRANGMGGAECNATLLM